MEYILGNEEIIFGIVSIIIFIIGFTVKLTKNTVDDTIWENIKGSVVSLLNTKAKEIVEKNKKTENKTEDKNTK